MVAKFALQDIQVVSPMVIAPFMSKSQKDKNVQDSNEEFFQGSLRKNLETLTFLAELESRYDFNKRLPKYIGDCNAIKIEVQQKTIELTRKLASYKNLHLK